ncbi:MAG: hypothetical protein ABI612_13045 [Betaproteobacteria bacterium]
MLDTKTTSNAPRQDPRLNQILGDIEAASVDTQLLAYSLVMEAARSGPAAGQTALIAQAMCNLSARATAFSQRVRAGLPVQATITRVGELRQISRAVADLMQEAATLAATDLDGTEDEADCKPARLLEEIDAKMRAMDDVLIATDAKPAA